MPDHDTIAGAWLSAFRGRRVRRPLGRLAYRPFALDKRRSFDFGYGPVILAYRCGDEKVMRLYLRDCLRMVPATPTGTFLEMHV